MSMLHPDKLSEPDAATEDRADTKDVHVAVVGCGHWGPNHIRNLSGLPNCRVTAVDLDPARLSRIRDTYPQVRTATEFQRVLADATITAVTIATPTHTHYQLVGEALEAGKHVLCEKPLCTLTDEALQLVELAARYKLILMTGHIFLFNPGIQKTKELAQSGELGRLLCLSAVRTNLGPIRSDVNAAFDLASHDVAVFNWILETEPVQVSATGGDYVQPDIHDVVFVNLKYPDGQVASIHASWLNPKKVRQITVVGSDKMVTWDDLDPHTPVAVYDRGASVVPETGNFGEFQRVSMWDGDVRLPKIQATEPLKIQSLYFLNAIRSGALDMSSGKFSLGVVRTLDAINRSLQTDGMPVTL